MDPTRNEKPNSELSIDITYKSTDDYTAKYSTYAPAVQVKDYLIFAKLELIENDSQEVVFVEYYPNYVTRNNVDIAFVNMRTNTEKFINHG